VSCDVVAPALIPRKPGERVKTNRRDARKLTELGRAGLLTAVQPPTPEDEAVRDLARARDDAREDLQRGRHRLGKLLLRRGQHYSGRNWTRGHRQWIDSLEWVHAAERAVVDDYLLAIDHTEARLVELDARLAEIAEREPYRAPVGWLRCFRGIDTLTAMLILAELHDFRRFASAPALMAYLGLVPGEHSSGEKHRRGRITRTGERARPAAVGRNGLALSTSPDRRRRLDAAAQGPACARDCDCGQGAAAAVSALPEIGGRT
jgi:transposase